MLYDTSFIKRYLNGEEINNVDRLENDPVFIFEATMYSRDRNMYNLWDDSMRTNYLYVRRLVMRFKDDIDFINKVSINYFKDSKVDENYFELCIIVRNYALGKDDSVYGLYDNMCFQLFDDYMYEIKKDKLPSTMGFEVVLSYFKSNIVKDYFAEMFIDDIFTARYEHFDSESEKNKRIDQFIGKGIEKKDAFLRKYIKDNSDKQIVNYRKRLSDDSDVKKMALRKVK